MAEVLCQSVTRVPFSAWVWHEPKLHSRHATATCTLHFLQASDPACVRGRSVHSFWDTDSFQTC